MTSLFFLIQGSIKSFGLMNDLFFPSIFFKLLYFSIVFWLHEGFPIFLGGRLFFPKWSHGTVDGVFSCISTKECDVFVSHTCMLHGIDFLQEKGKTRPGILPLGGIFHVFGASAMLF